MPQSSVRTRVAFERGIYLLGGQVISFSNEVIDKKEDLRDVCGYLNNWADLLVIRYPALDVLKKLAGYSKVPVINAMTSQNHPCEIMTDLYALSKIRKDFLKDKYLFCGLAGNIGYTWKAAAKVLGLEFSACCPKGYEIEGVKTYYSLDKAIQEKDVICTDSIPSKALVDFKDFRITKEVMQKANEGAVLNPCPPFYRKEEVSEDVIDSKYFVGYDFKKYLVEVHQAIMIY